MYTFGHRVDLLWVIALTCAQAVRSPSTPPHMAYWVRPKVLWKGAYIEGWKLLQRYIYFIKLFGSILPALSLWTNTRHNLQLAIAFFFLVGLSNTMAKYSWHYRTYSAFLHQFLFYFDCCQDKFLSSPCRRTTGCSHQDWLVFQLPCGYG